MIIMQAELDSGLVAAGPLLEDGRPAILLPGYDWAPAHWATRRKARHLPTPDRLPSRPRGLLIHSGELGEDTAGWAHRDIAKYWAHFAHDGSKYVQTDSLDAWAPHGGNMNRWTWGIETPHFAGKPGHPPQDGTHKDQTIELVRRLATLLGDGFLTAHKFIDDQKRDPSTSVTEDWFDGLGLRCYWQWSGQCGGKIIVAERLR